MSDKKLPPGYGHHSEVTFHTMDEQSSASPACYTALSDLVAAWESLPEGNHSPRVIGAWLMDDMKPAIDAARKVLSAV